MASIARTTMAFILLTVAAQVHAQQPENIDIPCSEAPQRAVVSMPPRLQDVAQVICTSYGHFITAADGQYWTYPGAMAPAMLVAGLDLDAYGDAPSIVNHARHFTRIEARDITAADIARHVGTEDGLPPPPSEATPVGIEIVAVNQDDVEQKIILLSDGRSRWGYLCAPTCKPKESFLALDFRKQPAPAASPER
jgi:hypothetical protein